MGDNKTIYDELKERYLVGMGAGEWGKLVRDGPAFLLLGMIELRGKMDGLKDSIDKSTDSNNTLANRMYFLNIILGILAIVGVCLTIASL